MATPRLIRRLAFQALYQLDAVKDAELDRVRASIDIDEDLKHILHRTAEIPNVMEVSIFSPSLSSVFCSFAFNLLCCFCGYIVCSVFNFSLFFTPGGPWG